MLRVSVILIVGVFLQTFATVRCSPANFCGAKANGDYPDPSNCRGFISCSNHITHHMPCPAELKWNNQLKRCDWPQNANPPCGPSSNLAPSYSCQVQVISSNSCSDKANGNYPDPSNCHGYRACANGLTYRMPCPAQLKWNDRQKRCDWPQHAYPACSGATAAPTTVPVTSPVGVGVNFCREKANANYPDPNNCYGYIACSNGITYHMPCPARLKWNDRKKRCVWPQHAYPACSGVHQWPCYVCVYPNGNSQSDFCSNKINGNYPNSGNCYGYIACSNGITYHMPCPAGLVWNDGQKICDWKRNVRPPCGTLTTPVTTSSPVSSVTTSAPSSFNCAGKSNGNYPDLGNCYGYISCSNGITYRMPCPASLVWNDVQEICDRKLNVRPPCGTLTTPEPCSVNAILRCVLDELPKGSVEVNNHLVGALFQVVKGMGAAKGIPKYVRVNKYEIIERIKKAMDHKGYIYARTMMGFILQKQDRYGTCVKIMKEIKNALGKDKFKDFLAVDGNVSLAFVIDTTGSMHEEIDQAKAIARAIASYERKGTVNYILSPYNDPGSGPVTKYESRANFEVAINRLYARGGGDCNELTFNGIIDAIKIGEPLPNSPMYVFTDAPPKAKGEYTRDNAIRYAQDYMMPVHFFFSTRGCGNPGNNADYNAIMKYTGGLGLFFQSASAISSADALVKADLDGSTIISSGRSSSSRRGRDLFSLWERASRDVAFPVDESVANLIVSISAQSYWHRTYLVDSSGRRVNHTLTMNRGKLWLIKNPRKGTWRLAVSSSVRGLSYEIKASSISNIQFDQMFVRTLKASGMVVPISNPLVGEPATVKLLLPNISRLDMGSLKVDLVNEQGARIKGLTKKGDTATFDLPSARAFKIRLSGRTRDGNAFQRLSREEIKPQTAILRAEISQSLLTIKRGVRSSFRAAIDYPGSGSKTFTVKASVIPSNVTISFSRSLRVTKTSPGYVDVYLTAPAGTPVGKVVKVHILAYSGDIKLNLFAHLMVK